MFDPFLPHPMLSRGCKVAALSRDNQRRRVQGAGSNSSLLHRQPLLVPALDDPFWIGMLARDCAEPKRCCCAGMETDENKIGSSRLSASVLATAQEPRGPLVLWGKYLGKYYPHLIAQAADSQLIERV